MATAKKETFDIPKVHEDMLNALQGAQQPLIENTSYYESESRPASIGIGTPPEMRKLLVAVGYARIYLNALGDRLDLEGFRVPTPGGSEPEDGENETAKLLWNWWQANDLDIESGLGHIEALVNGRSYITVSKPDPKIDIGLDPEVPIIRVESPTALYADIDPRTRLVTKAIRATTKPGDSEPSFTTLYLPDQTIVQEKVQGTWTVVSSINHGLGVVPVIPLANRSRISDLLGTSEITPELRSITDAASRILMNLQATAELMAVPQRLLFGVKRDEVLGEAPDPDDEDAVDTRVTGLEAYVARILTFEDPEAHATQFSAAELRNFVDALEELAKHAAAYTGLPPQYLSAQSDNPASAEAIRSSETRLVRNAERKARVFGGAWEQAMRVALLVMGQGEITPELRRMEAVWRDPSTPTYAAKADAASKLYNQGLGVIPKERARIDMGYSIVERQQMREWDETENPVGQLTKLYGGGQSPPPNQNEPASDEPETETAA